MIFTQYYLDCLSQASYLIGDEGSGQAVVVDPRRDVQEYLDDAAAAGLRIVGVIDTHFHADFLAGHLELARATGAWIGFGAQASPDFEARPLADGERISLGDVTLQIMETPGHTPESISVLVFEHADDEVAYGVLTGDALFIGDVGRPDLLASVGVSQDELARMLHDSVQRKLMSLPDDVRVFPAHGAGSACGKNLSTERQSTIGAQRRENYACRPMSVDEFVGLVTVGQPAAPAYFGYDADLNRRDREVLDPGRRVPELSAAEFDAAIEAGARVHDARPHPDFAAGHVAGSVNVPADGRMAETVGMVFSPDERVVVVAEDAQRAQEVALRFSRIGFDSVVGYLDDVEGYLRTHPQRAGRASRLTATALDEQRGAADLQVVDVRGPGEVADGAIDGAATIPLPQLRSRSGELDPARPTVVYCAGGWRSSVAASLLREQGFADVSDLLGGYGAWAGAHAPA